MGKVLICSNDSSKCALSESARIFFLNMKTDTADPTVWYDVSEMSQSTRNNDSQKLTTGVYLNVINSLWHEFFNSIHPNLTSGNKKCIFLAAPTVCNPFNCCADVWTYIDFCIRRIWTLITWVINAVGKGFICSNDSSECLLSESANFFFSKHENRHSRPDWMRQCVWDESVDKEQRLPRSYNWCVSQCHQ